MTRHFFASITRNKTSLIGTALVVGSLTLIVTLFVVQSLGLRGGAYLGIITFVVLPMFLLTGLILIPVGITRDRKRIAAEGEELAAAAFPVLDFNKEQTRKFLALGIVFTTVSIVVLAAATYKGVDVMDSTTFCGTACHTVMQPEFTAHQRSPHARVACADCHIGPGADWFVKSKLSGAWQLIAVAFDLYPTPIPTPIHDLRPARETCEQCHWPTTYVGDLLKVKTVYTDDEENTPLKTAVLLKVGGLAGRDTSGIHWHVNPDIQIRYRSDETRETIYDVELTTADGEVKVYKTRNMPDDAMPWRVMDCVDCHNRPTHRYRLPMDEVDNAMANGYIDNTLPYIKRESMELLRAEYATHDEAREAIPRGLLEFYEENYHEVVETRLDDINKAAEELVVIYTSNVFPEMSVDWGTYPDHSEHMDSPGCWRCHDRKHRTEDREQISRDCGLCHTILAQEEEDPEILETLNP
ncbi:MAG: cytochrome C [Woeseiaceae bacterium]|nr:cytochrome C [Woeseiaceae bacterium]